MHFQRIVDGSQRRQQNASCVRESTEMHIMRTNYGRVGAGARLLDWTDMNARVDHLLDEVLGLPEEERSAVAAALIDSLEGSEDASVSQAWRQELLRRRDALRSGASTAVPWVEARARISAL